MNYWKVIKKKVKDRTGKILSKYEVQRIMADTPDALSLYNKGLSNIKTSNAWGWISIGSYALGITFMILGGLEYKNSDNDILPATFYVGCGFVGFGIVTFFPAYAKSKAGIVNIDSAVDIYNSAAIRKQRNSDVSLNFGITRSGRIGFTLNF